MMQLSGPTRRRANKPIPLHFHLLCSFTLLALLLAARPVLAEEPEEVYLPIYSQIQDAESLEASGHPAQALTNYQHAAAALQALQKKYPDWNSRVVNSRLARLGQKITALSEGPATAVQARTNAPAAAPATSSAPASAEGKVKLLDAGAEPRKALRLHPKAGDKQSVEMTLKMKMETKVGAMEAPAMDLPPIKMLMDLSVKEVSAAGDIIYEMLVNEATVAEDASGGAAMAEMMKASLGAAKGVTGTGTITDRGVSKAMNVKMGNTADAQSRQAMDQMKGMMSGAILNLPEEAIGVGAKWEVQKVSKAQGFPMNETATYEITSIAGDQLKVKVTVTQSAANQKMQNATAGRAGIKMELTKLSGEGTGELTCDLGQLMPLEAASKEHMEMTMTVSAPQKQTMNQKVDLDVRMRSK